MRLEPGYGSVASDRIANVLEKRGEESGYPVVIRNLCEDVWIKHRPAADAA